MPFLPLFTGIRHLTHVLIVPPTKARLLCATPADMDLYIQAMPVGTYRVQSPGFPKIVYSTVFQQSVCFTISRARLAVFTETSITHKKRNNTQDTQTDNNRMFLGNVKQVNLNICAGGHW